MGQNPSTPKRRLSLRSTVFRRSKRSNYSLIFAPNIDQFVEQININVATEEELMTLPEVTRAVAKCIVDYRRLIGRFRRVEDLALVNGIGAEKFEKIKAEVCVRSIIPVSRTHSMDSLRSVESRSTKLLNLNTAGVFDLHRIPGMTQEMAANITQYRSKKGPFKRLDDLSKVRSISNIHLSNFRHYLTINDDDGARSVSRTNSVPEALSNGSTPKVNGDIGLVSKHHKTSSAPVKLQVVNGVHTQLSITDIFDLLSAYSYRPIPEEEFTYQRNGQQAVRIATWNFHQFTLDKAQNFGVREVICRTILENCLSIICLQEIYDEEALQIICDELNTPRLKRVVEWRRNYKCWDYGVTSHGLGFLFESNIKGMDIEIKSITEAPNDAPGVLADISIGQTKLSILNVHLNTELSTDILEEYLQQISQDVVLLGDLTNLTRGEQKSHIGNLQAIVPLHTNTACAHSAEKCNSNILVSNGFRSRLTGIWGMVKKGLTHLSIPNGWSWGGTVSPHCPLWTEIYVGDGFGAMTNGL